MTTFTEKIAALPKWPKEENYTTPMKLSSGVQVTYSYPADEIRCMINQLNAALARLALAREWIENNGHAHRCAHRIDFNLRCTCCRDALLAALGDSP